MRALQQMTHNNTFPEGLLLAVGCGPLRLK